MDAIIEQIADNWIMGLFLAITLLAIWNMNKTQQKEREDQQIRYEKQQNFWRDQVDKQHTQLVCLTKDTHSILSEMRTLVYNLIQQWKN